MEHDNQSFHIFPEKATVHQYFVTVSMIFKKEFRHNSACFENWCGLFSDTNIRNQAPGVRESDASRETVYVAQILGPNSALGGLFVAKPFFPRQIRRDFDANPSHSTLIRR